jgi:hypothetical protein
MASGCVRYWHEWDLRAAPTNVRSWESNGLNADVVFGPFMSSRPEESHPRALPKPCVNLSIHTAPDVRPFP